MDDLEYFANCANQQVDKLDRHLNDAMQKLKSFEDTTIVHDGTGKGVTGVAKSKVIDASVWQSLFFFPSKSKRKAKST